MLVTLQDIGKDINGPPRNPRQVCKAKDLLERKGLSVTIIAYLGWNSRSKRHRFLRQIENL